MPRKSPVPTIRDKSTGRTEPERSGVITKHRQDPTLEQFDLWGLFIASWEHDQAAEPAPKRRGKPRQRRGSPQTG